MKIKVQMLRLGILLSLSILLTPSLKATHIIGGVMTYRHFGRFDTVNRYQLSLQLYSDCVRGKLTLPNEITIAVYRGSTNPRVVRINGFSTFKVRQADTGYVPPPEYPCLSPPSDVCVQFGNYQWQLNLPLSNESYFIVYQFCCRNEVIQNIQKPLERGATYFVEITPEAQLLGNSSPYFGSLPPTVICLKENLAINHTALDGDGDSLVYSLNAPYDEYSISSTGCGLYPCAPPFPQLSFRPPFDAKTPLGDDANPFIINPLSGILSGIAPLSGFFAFSVSVKEYRNGVLIGEIFRDFEFKVLRCKRAVTAQIAADTVIQKPNGEKVFIINVCKNPLQIEHTSFNKINISNQVWRFNSTPSVVANEWQPPPLNFNKSGTYHGSLFLNPNEKCRDSALIEIRVRDTFVASVLDKTATVCEGDSLKIGTKYYTKPQIVLDTVRSKGGCDSVVFRTQIAVTKPTTRRQNIVMCANQCFIFNKNRYCTEGVYSDTLQSVAGCDSIVITDLRINPKTRCDTVSCPLFTPNAFTPNGDTQNDTFQPYSTKAQILEMQLFNRWGNIVFKTQMPPFSWDGTSFDGKLLPSDVYVFLIKFICDDGKPYWQSGDVTLLR